MIIRPSHAMFAVSGWLAQAADAQMDAAGIFGAVLIGFVGIWASWWESGQ